MLSSRLRCWFAPALLLALLSGGSAEAKPVLIDIEVVPSNGWMIPGRLASYRALGIYSEGEPREITSKVRFISSDTEKAFFVKGNQIGAINIGDTLISATTKSGDVVSSQSALLHVAGTTALRFDPDDLDGIRLGREVPWNVVATLDNDRETRVTDLVEWGSSAPSVVRAGDDPKDRGLLRALAPGSATITVEDALTDVTAMLALTVVETLASIAISPDERILQLDEVRRFRTLGMFEGGKIAGITGDVRFRSSDSKVATLAKDGTALPRGIGETIIAAEDRETRMLSSPAGDTMITVVGAVKTLTVEPASLILAVGATERVDAPATFVDTVGSFNWRTRVDWTSSDPLAATIESDGDVLCLSAGDVTLSAEDPKTGVSSTDSDGDGQLTCVAAP